MTSRAQNGSNGVFGEGNSVGQHDVSSWLRQKAVGLSMNVLTRPVLSSVLSECNIAINSC